MTPNRDISELFRQQAPQVQERPGVNVWRRLQRRLDSYERWHKTALRISTQGVLFTLLFIAIFGPVLIGISIEQQKRAALQPVPAVLQVLTPQDTLPEVRYFLEQSSAYPGDTLFIQIEQ